MNNAINISQDIERFLSARRLSPAFDLLDNALASDSALWKIKADIERLRESYAFMTRYALDGMPDPARPELYDELVASVRSLTDMINRQTRVADASTLYFNTLRAVQLQREENLSSLVAQYRRVNDRLSLSVLAENVEKAQRELTYQAEDLEKRLFNVLWTLYPLSVDDQTIIQSFLSDKALPAYAKSLLLGAVMAGLMEYYDERRMRILMDAYEVDDAEISVRALCGLLLGMWLHKERPMSSRLRKRFDALVELPRWSVDVKMVQLQFIRARETERISRKFTDEVIPEMMKLKPEIEKLQNRPLDPESIEENPEWEELLEKSGVADRLKELQEIQEDGGDVLMGTFSKLKTFPFFNDIANWFLPFHSSHSMMTGSFDHTTRMLFEMIVSAPMFCDSDKFSVILSLAQVPESQIRMMTDQIKAHSDQMAQMNLNELNSRGKGREVIANKFMQDLYRFYKLFRRKGEFKDPFNTSLNLIAHPLLREMFDDEETLRIVGEFYFKRKYYSDALDIFDKLSFKITPSAELFQKMGYCKQAMGDLNGALQYYEQSELLNSESRWTMRRLAACYKALSQWNKALLYYKRLAEFKPEDVNLALNIGYCLMETGKYDEALQHFFKAEFISGESERSARPIAWCSLLAGDYDRARKYIGILLSGNPSASDYLNAGHLELLTGHFADAVDRYAASIAARNFDVDDFMKAMHADAYLTGKSTEVDELVMGIIIDRAITHSRELGGAV
jgi:tetratricopeptide (TPR) repeat protein